MTCSHALRFLALTACLVACADDAAPSPDSGTDGGADATLDARDPDTGSEMCGMCAADEECIDGMCVAPTTCEATCAGCCDGDTCMDGTATDTCGSGGLMCRACGAGETCEAGECVPPCEAFCTGCCSAAGECLEGDADAACGVGGAACEACEGTCDSGACIATSCAESCDGCCSGDTCLAGDSSTACGAAGGACIDCGAGFTCGSGACAVDEAGRWDVLVEQVMAPTRDWEDRAWDIFGGLPDIVVRLTAMDGAEEVRGSTPVVSNDESPSWTDEVVLDGIPARALTAGTFVEIIDQDDTFDDTMTSCTWTPTSSDFVTGLVNVTCPARDVDHPDGPAVAASVVIRLRRD